MTPKGSIFMQHPPTMIFTIAGFCLGREISHVGGFLRMQHVEDKRTYKVV
jgi:hypothetical protein